MNIQKVSNIALHKTNTLRKTAAAILMGVGVVAGASAVTKQNDKKIESQTPTVVEKETEKKNDNFRDFFINLGLGTLVTLGTGAYVGCKMSKRDQELWEIMNHNQAQDTYKDNVKN